MSASSFVDVRHVFVDYEAPSNFLRKLSGKTPAPRSVLRDVTFQLQSGSQVVLFGVAGSGKSTLLRTLAGVLAPTRGHILINGKAPSDIAQLASGYVSVEESEATQDTVGQILHAFAVTHKLSAIPAKVGAIAEQLNISHLLERQASMLSTTERLRLNIARAALGSSPIILFDDVTDQLGASETTRLLQTVFAGRTVVTAMRSVDEAQRMELPILLMHKGQLVHTGLCNDIAAEANCPRVVHAWLEGLRYDTLRAVKRQPGVLEVRLLPTDQFEGQQLRIVVRSSRYLPALYDVISQSPLLRVEEEPVTLSEILASLK